jgi:sec-independent protein translocase protein TatC
VLVGADIDGGDHTDPDRYAPLTDEELEAHLDAAEADEAALEEQPGTVDAADTDQSGGQADQTSDRERAVDAKLRRVQELRAAEDYGAARALLYQVLEEGDADQRRVARNILQQLDMP